MVRSCLHGGLLLGWFYAKRLLAEDRLWPNGKRPFGRERTDDLLLFMTIGVLLGGRMGYVLFYEPRFFLRNPWEMRFGTAVCPFMAA